MKGKYLIAKSAYECSGANSMVFMCTDATNDILDATELPLILLSMNNAILK